MPNSIVIYHGNCADGFGAAWCFWHTFGDDMEYYAGEYQKPPPDVTDRDVYLVDFSYKRAVVEEMIKAAKSVTLIDHHKSALEDLVDVPGLTYYTDLNRSGAMLAWNFLQDLPPPALINHIQDRDLWQFKLEGTREIQQALFSYEYDFEVWNRLMLTPNSVDALYKEGSALVRKHFKDIKELLKTTQRYMDIAGFYVPVANLPYTFSSDAGHIMGVGQPFAACYTDGADGRNFSLRSAEDGIDVSEIAKQFGGGGHKHAAGFRVPRDHILATS